MKILTIYLTHHNNTQLRVFPASFKRRFGNISDLNFITARFQDEKITWHDHNLKSLELSREFSRPQLITEFFELISVIKQEKKFDNIILCLEANLGEASSCIFVQINYQTRSRVPLAWPVKMESKKRVRTMW